jgi:hypothetical protein
MLRLFLKAVGNLCSHVRVNKFKEDVSNVKALFTF